MKIWEIMKEENVGKRYKTNEDNENVYVITKGVNRFYLEVIRGIGRHTCILSCDLLERDFEEIIDWSKVAVDTKILVADFIGNDDEIVWKKRHFAKNENGKIYSWDTGFTSFTIDSDDLCASWDFVKLYKEEN